MAKEWENITGSFSSVEINQGSVTAAGTIKSKFGRKPIQYMASNQYGLLKLSTSGQSYKVVQLWVRKTVGQQKIVKARAIGPDGIALAGTGVRCSLGDTYGPSDTDGVYITTWLDQNDNPLPSNTASKLFCHEFGGAGSGDLYYAVDVGSGDAFNHYSGPFYYLDDSDNFQPYPGEYTRKSGTQADAWIKTTRDRQTAASRPNWAKTIEEQGDYRERLLPLMRANMQSILNQDATYKQMAAVSSGIQDPRLRVIARRILDERGYSASNIDWFFNPRNNPGILKITSPAGSSSPSRNIGNGSGSGGGVSRPNTFVAPTPAVTRVVVRAPFGYSRPPDRAPDQRPQIIQNYTDYIRDASYSGGYREVNGQDIFVFPYVPNNISYSGLGSQWTEIERQGNYPIVEWAKWDLMKVEMEFLLAEERVESGGTLVPDGIFNSVQGRLNTLRRMSQRRAAVSVFNLDDLFRVQIKRAAQTGKAMQFVIADLSVNASRRSLNSISKEITAATVKLTLQEIPIEAVTIVRMSPPKMTDPVVPKPASADTENSDPLLSDLWTATSTIFP